jgi:hypothetical protein
VIRALGVVVISGALARVDRSEKPLESDSGDFERDQGALAMK